MFEDFQICPYTGLRSFTEEESLYFKGREDHIVSATEQLQRNKFLMLTGASGDGKSSLVYAGIIPNARAGFLKSKYTQWCVADFRPERTPFHNLCKALAAQLEIAHVHTVESELHHGFSALVDLYRNSKRFVDTESVAWQQADESGKAALKREAANLIILVDQFEEFFTNPENYHRGVPSRDSNLVLNVLLETARIALEEDLPIYVVFTMRSDYIGQCAAFRGLPEYIGFSQFFVPRLNRAQLQQVIEEPAVLSGNRITRRLTERLIHDLTEGVDQLPILQHALNQVWHAANSGNEEMDLIHYAMVGGMAVSELPEDQVARFNQWFASLPAEIKACYHEPNLQNVLDTHTNKLYEEAATYYKTKTGQSISETDVKDIIRTAFICLTKIDQSRAVRNRMSMKEITSILGRAEYGVREVGAVLNIFREPGNTFIRPFITDEPESQVLKEDDVLDITHESLIRNWAYLEEWATEEFNNYTISLDFEQQLNRWVDSGKSNDFLLSIGPLTYFENWYNQVNPNVYWVARYLPEDIEQKNKLAKAKEVLANAQEFLKRSARKHRVTRAVMRYGPRKIVAALAVIALVVFSSFAVRDYMRKQNDYVLKEIRNESFVLANSKKADFYSKSILFAEQLKAGQFTVEELLAQVDDTLRKANVASRLGAVLSIQGRAEPKQEILQSLTAATNILAGFNMERKTGKELEQLVDEVVYVRAALGLAVLYRPTEELKNLQIKLAAYSASLVKHILNTQPDGFEEISKLNAALEHALNHQAFSNSDLEWLARVLSPFEHDDRSEWIRNRYHRDKLMVRSNQDYAFKFNGLYQELAYVYAALGDATKALQCIDTLLLYNQNYYQNDYKGMIDNASNIAVVFYRYGQLEALDDFIEGYVTRYNTSGVEFYQRWIGRSVPFLYPAGNTNEFVGTLSNLNCQLSDDAQLQFVFQRFRKEIDRVSDRNEQNFLRALSYKDEGVLRMKYAQVAGLEHSVDAYANLFDEAMRHYRMVDPRYLAEEMPISMRTDTEKRPYPRSYLFTFPDYRNSFTPLEPRLFFYPYTSEFWLAYLVSRNVLDELYPTRNPEVILNWLEYHKVLTFGYFHGNASFRAPINLQLMKKLESHLATWPQSANEDHNIVYLQLGILAYDAGEPDVAVAYLKKLDASKTVNLFQGLQDELTESFFLIARAVSVLSEYNQWDEAYALMRFFKNPINRSSLYAYAATELFLRDSNSESADRLLDSSRIEVTRIENLATGQPNRQLISFALALQNPEQNADEAYKVIKNIFNKTLPTQKICRSFAYHGKLYEARQQVTPNISDSDQATFLWNTIYGYSLTFPENKPEWQNFSKRYFPQYNRFIVYINENN